ncbi:MAG TPA: D-2-hydroxyacid dehydrogenase family protein, partial [Rhodospirillaceae bacterium]|nr:D-2-hydroxyacid dehydrogenase family protein [Rhodospirillaceae bacterium]
MKLYVLDDYQNVVRTLSASELLAGRGIDLTILTTPFADEQAAIDRLRDA